jgi:hypothetical protein
MTGLTLVMIVVGCLVFWHDVEPRANATVRKHSQIVTDRVHHIGQRTGSRDSAVELAAAVVGHNDPVGPGAHSVARIFWRLCRGLDQFPKTRQQFPFVLCLRASG